MGLARFFFWAHTMRYGGEMMDQNRFAEQLRRNPQILENLANSQDGQALMARLQSNGQALEQATQKGQQGDLVAMTKLLRSVMADREGRELLERLAKQIQG